MAQINWTAESERWLKNIHDYIALDSPAAAVRVVEEIYQKAQILVQFPEIGYRYHHPSDKHMRILLYGHYRIAYLVKQDTNIDILGIFHGAMQIEDYLRIM